MRPGCGSKAHGGKNHNDEKRHSDKQGGGDFPPPARPCQFRQVKQREADDPDCKAKLYGEKRQCAGCHQVGAEAQADNGDAERHDRPCSNCHIKRANDRIAVGRLRVSTQERNEIIRLHVRVSPAISAASALSPRWIFTFTPDSERPHLLAASAMLSPSSFTAWIEHCMPSGSRCMSRLIS